MISFLYFLLEKMEGKNCVVLPRFRYERISVTSPLIEHMCSCHARTVTWEEPEQSYVQISANNTFTTCVSVFSRLFCCLFRNIPDYFLMFRCYFHSSDDKKVSKFERNCRRTGNSSVHLGFFPFPLFFFLLLQVW